MRNTVNSVGTHIIGELFGCGTESLSYKKDVEEILVESAKKANFTMLHEYFYQFEPIGVTGVVVLSQSHVSIHTWPEHNYVAVDVFSCGTARQAQQAFDFILKSFAPKHYNKRILVRGVVKEPVKERVCARVPKNK